MTNMGARCARGKPHVKRVMRVGAGAENPGKPAKGQAPAGAAANTQGTPQLSTPRLSTPQLSSAGVKPLPLGTHGLASCPPSRPAASVWGGTSPCRPTSAQSYASAGGCALQWLYGWPHCRDRPHSRAAPGCSCPSPAGCAGRCAWGCACPLPRCACGHARPLPRCACGRPSTSRARSCSCASAGTSPSCSARGGPRQGQRGHK